MEKQYKSFEIVNAAMLQEVCGGGSGHDAGHTVGYAVASFFIRAGEAVGDAACNLTNCDGSQGDVAEIDFGAFYLRS